MSTDLPKRLTANEIVSARLQQARRRKGWTQAEAARRLEPFLGQRWSRPTFSLAERSYASDRVRRFDADDLVAFATVFGLPPTWFLTPPDGVEEIRAQDATESLDADQLSTILHTPAEERQDPLRLRGAARYHQKLAEEWRSGRWMPAANAIDRAREALREEAMGEVLLEQAELIEARRG